MSWSLAAIREGLAVRLRTIDGLNVYSTVPGSIVVPAAIIMLGDGQFLTYDTSSDSDGMTWTVRVFTSLADNVSGQTALDEYLLRTGDYSIRAALAADPTLGGAVDYADVTGASGYGIAPVGAVEYFGCDFAVDVALS